MADPPKRPSEARCGTEERWTIYGEGDTYPENSWVEGPPTNGEVKVAPCSELDTLRERLARAEAGLAGRPLTHEEERTGVIDEDVRERARLDASLYNDERARAEAAESREAALRRDNEELREQGRAEAVERDELRKRVAELTNAYILRGYAQAPRGSEADALLAIERKLRDQYLESSKPEDRHEMMAAHAARMEVVAERAKARVAELEGALRNLIAAVHDDVVYRCTIDQNKALDAAIAALNPQEGSE